jgi:DNA-binding Xre family transcriptional regulator
MASRFFFLFENTYIRIRNNEHFTTISLRAPRKSAGNKCVKGGEQMSVKDAVVQRFEQICKERNIKINELATRAGVTPSTAYSMMKPTYRHISIVTIKKLCDGLDMTLGEFFSTPEFDELEQEIY